MAVLPSIPRLFSAPSNVISVVGSSPGGLAFTEPDKFSNSGMPDGCEVSFRVALS